jgi:hypothetical protein
MKSETVERSVKQSLWRMVDHGRNCGNAIRFEVQDQREHVMASIEVEEPPHAKRIALIMAAAPELLEACKIAVDALEWYGEENAVARGALKEIREAIAKAEGKE